MLEEKPKAKIRWNGQKQKQACIYIDVARRSP